MLNIHIARFDGCWHLIGICGFCSQVFWVILVPCLMRMWWENPGKLKSDTALVRFYYPTCSYMGIWGEVIQAGTQLTIGCMPRTMTTWSAPNVPLDHYFEQHPVSFNKVLFHLHKTEKASRCFCLLYNLRN